MSKNNPITKISISFDDMWSLGSITIFRHRYMKSHVYIYHMDWNKEKLLRRMFRFERLYNAFVRQSFT